MPWDGDPMTFEPNTVLFASDLNTELRDRAVTLRAGGFALVGQVAGDLMTAVNETQWQRLTREELLSDLDARVTALEAGGSQMVRHAFQVNDTIAFEVQGDYDFVLPETLDDFTRAEFTGAFYAADGGGAFLNVPYFVTFVDADTIRVTTTANAGAPSVGRLVGFVKEWIPTEES